MCITKLKTDEDKMDKTSAEDKLKTKIKSRE